MDAAVLPAKKLLRTKCATPLLYLFGCVLCAAVCAGNPPHLITYRPAHVTRDTDGGVFVVGCKLAARLPATFGCLKLAAVASHSAL